MNIEAIVFGHYFMVVSYWVNYQRKKKRNKTMTKVTTKYYVFRNKKHGTF